MRESQFNKIVINKLKSNNINLTEKEYKLIINEYLSTLIDETLKNGKITINNFATFRKVDRKGYIAKINKNKFIVPAKTKIKVKMSRHLIDKVNR